MAQDKAARADALYRVDRFIVPPAARDEFVKRVAATSRVLHCQPGFRRELVLEQNAGPGVCNFVTLVEWESAAAIGPASEAVARAHAESGFDRHAFLEANGIRADIASYGVVDLEA
jgi:heme-degrading monooxygenase HmoA